ncbi:MAG: L-lactate permease [Ktedonobacteraceae bacterium]|nr:L-lactate permease [Ktedonobacteraceae bacterium]
MTWMQTYTPVAGNLALSALVAALPVVVLLGLLGIFRVRAHWAALAGLATAFLVALLVYGMPFSLAFPALLNGAAYGLFPIGWIILGAIFVYDITVQTGKFEIIKQTVAGLASDRRLQLLLIAFSFGAFIEGAAGFGTPVAVSAAMLIGLGFRPLPAAGLALIGNTAPVAYGALGTPIIALASVTNLPIDKLSAMVGRQLPFFSLIVPFWLVWAMAGWRGMREVWPACLVAGASFAITQFLVSNLYGPTLVDIAGSVVSIVCLVLFLRIWQPKTTWLFPEERETAAVASDSEQSTTAAGARGGGGQPAPAAAALVSFDESDVDAAVQRGGAVSISPAMTGNPTSQQKLIAWMPWIILAVVLFIWGLPPVKTFLNNLYITNLNISVPLLDKAVIRVPPVVPKTTPETAVFQFNWLSATGTGLLITGIIGGLVLGVSPLRLLRIFWGTLLRLRFSLLTIAAMLAIGYTTRYAGLDATMGLAFASTGVLFPFFSALLGWLGVALTGSDTSSNVLFGSLQKITASKLGLSPILSAASNSSGGVMGKMIDAQSIVVAGVATGQRGGEGQILRYVFFHSIALAALVGILVMLQAYVFPGMIP